MFRLSYLLKLYLLANCLQLSMASAGQGSPLRSQLALKLKPNTPKKSAPTPSPTVQVSFFFDADFYLI